MKRMKHIMPHDLECTMRKYLPQCIVSYDSKRDMYLIKNPPTGVNYIITNDALHRAPSLSYIAGWLAFEMNSKYQGGAQQGSSVGFYGKYPSPEKPPVSVGLRSFNTMYSDDLLKPPKENTMTARFAGETQLCPECLAPEEAEITAAESTYRIAVSGSANNRIFIVNAFSSLEAASYAIEILQVDQEAGETIDFTSLQVEILPSTTMLI